MAPWNLIWRAWLAVEDVLVAQILRSPTFHHNVRKIHRRVHEFQHGRNPHEPLYPGEATELPKDNKTKGEMTGFMRYFVEELKNQARGKPTTGDVPPRPPRGPEGPRR